MGLPWCSGNVCTIPDGAKWTGKAAARCRDCVSPAVNLCEAPPELLVHQYLNRLDAADWRGNLLSLQAYLMTQARPPAVHVASLFRCCTRERAAPAALLLPPC